MPSASLITILTADSDLQFFVSSDVYRFDVDNRPLGKLRDNDALLQTGANAVIQEVFDARTNAAPTYFSNLKARLDSMDLLSGSSSKVIHYQNMNDRARLWRAQFASGFFNKVGEVYDANEVETSSPVYGDQNIPFGAIVVTTRPDDGSNSASIPANHVNISASHMTRTGGARAIDVMLAGFHVKLQNEMSPGATSPALLSGLSILFPAAPATGQRFDFAFLEIWFANVDKGLANTNDTNSFYSWGAVGFDGGRIADPSNGTLQGNVWFNPANGDYIQMRHRLRVVSNVDYVGNPFGFTDTSVLVQGGAGSPVAAHNFVNGRSLLNDASVWVGGDGSGGDATALGSIGGRVYAMPLMMVSRRNTTAWGLTNQNGGTSRPDGLTYDFFVKGDIIDMRPQGFTDRSDLGQVAEESFDKLVRGRLRTVLGQLAYDTTTDTLQSNLESVYGTDIQEVNYISDTATAHTNSVRDFNDDGSLLGISKPLNFRRVFGPARNDQIQAFHVNLSTNAVSPANFVSYDSGTKTITLNANGADGHGPVNAKIKDTPITLWDDDRVTAAVVWSDIGKNTATGVINVGDGAYESTGIIDGVVTISWPSSTGTRHSDNRVAYQDYKNPSAVVTPTQRIRGLNTPTGIFAAADGRIYVCDRNNHRVIRYLANGTLDGQFPGAPGSFPGPGSDNAHLNSPNGVAVDGAGALYIADTGNHRVIKVTGGFTYVGQFGNGSPAADNTHLNSPEGVAVDVSGNVFVGDTLNYRVVKLDNTLTYVGQFGSTGVTGSSASTCVLPRRCMVGGDGNLYVADTLRVLVLDPSGTNPALLTILVGGQGPAEGAAITAFNGVKALSTTEDSAGNIYVAGGGTSAVYKFDSNLNLLGTFGSGSNDLKDLWTGPADPNKHIHCGLPRDVVVDEANDSIFVADNTFGPSPGYGRILVLNRTPSAGRLTFKDEYVLTNPRPWMDGSPGLPQYPNPPYPDAVPIAMTLDVSNRKLYIAIGFLRCVEKWTIGSGDSMSSLSFDGKFGAGTSTKAAQFNFEGWRGPVDNITRLSYPQMLALSSDGLKLYVADQNLSQLLTGNFGSRVVRLNTAMSFDAMYGDLNTVNINARGYLQFVTGIAVTDSGTDRVYVSDAYANPPTVAILSQTGWDTTGDTGSPGVHTADLNNSTWISARIKPLAGQNNYLSMNGISLDNKVLYINPGFATQRWAINTSVVTGATKDVPLRFFLNISGGYQMPIQIPSAFVAVSDVWMDGTSTGRLLISDNSTNLIYCLSTPDFFPLGKAGTPEVFSFGFGGWAKPNGVAINTLSGVDYFYFTDLGNNCLFKASPYYAFVERTTGRIETLLPLPEGAISRVYSQYTPYQGVYQKPDLLGNADHTTFGQFFASQLVLKPDKILATTLGRVGVESGDLDGTVYASPLSHLPLGAEYLWLGDKLQFSGGIPDSNFIVLPVLQRSGSPIDYPDDSESFFDRDTIVSVASPALALPPGTFHGGYVSVTDSSNRFPSISTYKLANPKAHINATYGVLEYQGELMLIVRSDYRTDDQNIVGPPVTPLVDTSNGVDIFRLSGNPFISFRETR